MNFAKAGLSEGIPRRARPCYHGRAMQPSLSIIIPTLNGAQRLPACLAALTASGSAGQLDYERLVIDGGSNDSSAAVASAAGARVITAAKGRGTQLRQGAKAAAGDWLFFLHDDTRLGETWQQLVIDFIGDPANQRRAGYCRLDFDEPGEGAARVAALANWRARALGLPYGDQGLLIARDFYLEMGGHPAQPLMEDVALVRKIGRRRLAMLNLTAVTSAARYRRDGWWRRPIRNLWLLGLYFLGVSPSWLAARYR